MVRSKQGGREGGREGGKGWGDADLSGLVVRFAGAGFLGGEWLEVLRATAGVGVGS